MELCEETKKTMISQLIGLGECQRRIYEKFQDQPEAKHKRLKRAYALHCKELDDLIKYQSESNERRDEK